MPRIKKISHKDIKKLRLPGSFVKSFLTLRFYGRQYTRGAGGGAFFNTRIKTSLFMIANENTRARGKEVKNCRCCERQRAKA